MDEKMLLRLKVSRLRKALVLLAVLFLIMLYSNYSKSRYNLLYDASQAEQTLYKISFNLDGIVNDNAPITSFSENIEVLNNQENNAIMRDLNLVEKSRLKKAPNELFMNPKVDFLYNLLKTRHMNGTFTSRDQRALSLFNGYMKHITKELSEVRLNLNKLNGSGRFGALVKPINIKGIAEDYDRINQLALLYIQYDKLPGELVPMSIEDLKARLKSILKFNNPDITFSTIMEGNIRLNGGCPFEIREGALNYNGEIDAYTGIIKSLNTSTVKDEGKILALSEVKAKLMKLFERIYGIEQSFKVQYAGINYHFSSNRDTKLYSFKVYPIINGVRVDCEMWVFMDARTGNLFSISRASGQDYVVPDYSIDTAIKLRPQEGLLNLNIMQKGEYAYSETLIIKSSLSGKYVQVYAYKNRSNTVYVNTKTGKQEYVY